RRGRSSPQNRRKGGNHPMFMSDYNLMGNQFKSENTPEQAYDKAIQKFNEYYTGHAQEAEAMGWNEDHKARVGMSMIQRERRNDIRAKTEEKYHQLQQEYLDTIKGRKGAGDERWGIITYGSTSEFRRWLKEVHGINNKDDIGKEFYK
ncbi:MAG: hypothetical protein ACI4WS_06165, partial [Oscillospiraceae bacterium]